MTKRLDLEQITLEQRAIDAIVRDDPEELRSSLHDLGFVKNPSKLDAERLMDRSRLSATAEDAEIEIDATRGDGDDRATHDPRPSTST